MKSQKTTRTSLKNRNRKLKNFSMLEVGKEYTVIDVSKDYHYRGEKSEYERKPRLQVDKVITWCDNLIYIGSNDFFLVFKHKKGFNITFNKNLEQTQVYCGKKKITKHAHIKKPCDIIMY